MGGGAKYAVISFVACLPSSRGQLAYPSEPPSMMLRYISHAERLHRGRELYMWSVQRPGGNAHGRHRPSVPSGIIEGYTRASRHRGGVRGYPNLPSDEPPWSILRDVMCWRVFIFLPARLIVAYAVSTFMASSIFRTNITPITVIVASIPFPPR